VGLLRSQEVPLVLGEALSEGVDDDVEEAMETPLEEVEVELEGVGDRDREAVAASPTEPEEV
jgi:hypothetical protein